MLRIRVFLYLIACFEVEMNTLFSGSTKVLNYEFLADPECNPRSVMLEAWRKHLGFESRNEFARQIAIKNGSDPEVSERTLDRIYTGDNSMKREMLKILSSLAQADDEPQFYMDYYLSQLFGVLHEEVVNYGMTHGVISKEFGETSQANYREYFEYWSARAS